MENNFLGSRSGFPHKGVFLTKVIKASIVAFIKTKTNRENQSVLSNSWSKGTQNKLAFSVEPCTYHIKASNLSPSTGPRLVCTSLADDIDIIEINVSSR